MDSPRTEAAPSCIGFDREALGHGADGQPVYLREIWPSSQEIDAVLPFALDPETFRRRYADVGADQDLWKAIPAPAGEVYDWPPSTYIARPPFFELPTQLAGDLRGARALLILGDSVTTDHISPAGSFGENTPAGQWLTQQGVSRYIRDPRLPAQRTGLAGGGTRHPQRPRHPGQHR